MTPINGGYFIVSRHSTSLSSKAQCVMIAPSDLAVYRLGHGSPTILTDNQPVSNLVERTGGR